MHEDAMKVKKRNPNVTTKVTQNALF
jgi:hypothetical protein